MTLPMELPSSTTRDRLTYDATVPRAMVHRASIAEVFVTDSVAAATNGIGRSEASFEVAAQLPRGHVIGERSAAYDFLLIVEVMRGEGLAFGSSALALLGCVAGTALCLAATTRLLREERIVCGR